MTQHVDVIMDKFKNYIEKQLITLSESNPLLAISKPIVSRMIDNNLYKIETFLKQISDKDGKIDTNQILSEMIDNIVATKPFKMDAGFLGDLEIGGGKIKFNLPIFNKAVVLNHQDLLDFKDVISK